MPSFCLPVGNLEMAHCCVPYALTLSLSLSHWPEFEASQMENLRCNWVVANKIVCTVRTWIMTERMAERWIVWKPTRPVAFFFFFPIVKYICLQNLWKAHKAAWRLKMCFLYVRTSLCDTQGKMLFFTPNCCLWEASVKNYFSLQSQIDKSNNMKSACSYFSITRRCVRIQNLLVWFRSSTSRFKLWMYATLNTRKQTDSQLNLPIIKLYRQHWVARCTP